MAKYSTKQYKEMVRHSVFNGDMEKARYYFDLYKKAGGTMSFTKIKRQNPYPKAYNKNLITGKVKKMKRRDYQ